MIRLLEDYATVDFKVLKSASDIKYPTYIADIKGNVILLSEEMILHSSSLQ